MQHTYNLNNLDPKSGAEIAHAVAALPASVSSLNLRFNSLGNKSGAELAQAFAALPASVSSLDVSYNSLDLKSGAELAQAFAALPTSVNSLDVSENSLGNKSGAELAQAFVALPASVSSLHLSGNYFDQLPLEELNKLRNSLPNIETITLSESEIAQMEPMSRAALKAIFPNIKTIILLDNYGAIRGGNDLEACHYFASKLGLTKIPPSLKSNVAAFFAHHKDLHEQNKNLPDELQEFMRYF